eukprot:CAMPEP_0206593138 /NCGR_PEP_ID=MMETSP0325_2-20121206/41457_1 /ASSEMBLY_ACC=CAM_ASM_000347 /TAXON_ID=2866 /ORGANISM="Crypthecodinium cohnii, Strain Seligo" /LENGTH=278 /DNA_ID=CAMNT_0054103065 /DNA_START=113 /DNA_END=949 /DNA_ORIENTATION=+
MKLRNLLQKERSQAPLVQLRFLLEVQRDLVCCRELQARVAEAREDGVEQGLCDRQSLRRVKDQHLLEQVAALRIHASKPLFDPSAGLLPKALHVALRVLAFDRHHIFRGRCSDKVADHTQLVSGTLSVVSRVVPVAFVRREREASMSREERSSFFVLLALQHHQKLSEDARRRPNIDGLGVAVLEKDQFRGPIPPRHDVPSELSLFTTFGSVQVGGLSAYRSCKAEITDFDAAVLVDQAVRRLEVSVPDPRVDANQHVVHQAVNVGMREVDVGPAQLL